MYIIIKLLSYYYYFIIIFFPHERRGLYDPILVPNKPNIIIIIVSSGRLFHVDSALYRKALPPCYFLLIVGNVSIGTICREEIIDYIL